MDRQRGARHGINTIQINRAREIHAQTVRSRIPQPTAASSTLHSHDCAPTVPRYRSNNPNNPPCAHCGTVIIPAPKATFPFEDTPSITVDDWTITTRKKPILNSQELDQWGEQLSGLTLPEMIFGNSYVQIKNEKHDLCIQFNALDALKAVKMEDSGIRVSYAHKWIKSKREQQKTSELHDSSLKIAQHYDWTYTTKYKGTHAGPEFIRDDSTELPLDKLAKPDPILFYDDMVLFEDELADNGISLLNVKVRVMHERLLILSRFFLRVDGVLFRVFDTRVYVDFHENKVIREYKEHEGEYNAILAKHKMVHSHDPKAVLRDSNWVAQQLPLVKRECEVLELNKDSEPKCEENP
ncbi:LAFE_0B10264g1_1 [Lachancea fermentati]|uniref:LAFE_0B10264g1_1 n=1 Tax=Lachancea fermentati TaxID=4955 RepID=A0A1G4M8F7_LACFM|nr:LAFE_0B10264g1_1 [Lachancea fermentati]